MIVPFVFNLYNLSSSVDFQWVFYKYLDFCIKNNMPIIAQEEHFLNPRTYENNHSVTSSPELFNYKIYNEEKINSVVNYKINETFMEEYKKDEKKLESKWTELLSKEDKELEKEINNAIDSIEKQTNNKIETILCWLTFPSLIKVCKKRKIKLFNTELTTLRKNGLYNDNLGIMVENTKYSNEIFSRGLENFSSEKLLSRKEILALFLNTNQLNLINKLEEVPQYEVGIVTGLKNDVYELSHHNVPYIEIKKKLDNIIDSKKVVIRTHPHKPIDLKKFKYDIDSSPNSYEFILKCKRIICNLSNISYETILLGRTLYTLSSDNTFYNENVNVLNLLEEKNQDNKYLNYITFGYYIPFDSIFNVEYIKGKSNKVNINEEYENNLKYILESKKIDFDYFFKLEPKKRLNYIIEKVHNLKNYELKDNTDKYNEIKNLKKYEEETKIQLVDLNSQKEKLSENNTALLDEINNINEIVNENQKLIEKMNHDIKFKEEAINNLNSEIEKLYNSNSWKITKPLRKFIDIFRKIK